MPKLEAQLAPTPPCGDNPCGDNRRTRRHRPVQQAFVGIPEAATYLGVAEKTIRRFIRADKLPAYRLGNRVIKLRLEDVESLLVLIGGGDAA
jgi:excisionase family DNA binding protein